MGHRRNETQLVALDAVALDTGTTGLCHRTARIGHIDRRMHDLLFNS
jgi:hypothetical protein